MKTYTADELKAVLYAHLKWLRAEEGGERANLTGADLTGADLRRADLSRASLSRADLTGADLSRASLTGADLSRADLTGADLSRASLSRADLTWADLTGASLTGANLSEASLTGADLSRASLSRADLTGANLSEASLTGASLTGANLTGADLTGATMPSPNTPETLDEAIDNVKAWLTEERWVKGKWIETPNGAYAGDCRACLHGAVIYIGGPFGKEISDKLDSAGFSVGWNDETERKYDDIMDALDSIRAERVAV